MNVRQTKVRIDPRIARMWETLNSVIRERGLVPPIFVASIGVNGSGTIVKCHQQPKRPEVLTELLAQFGAPGMSFPINVLLADERGTSALVQFELDGAFNQLH